MQNQSLTKSPPTQPSKSTGITENDVESDCIAWLKALGWRVDRNNRGLYYTPDGRKQMIGRKGQCDWRAVRRFGTEVQYFEFEAKSPTGSVSKEQAEYIAILRHYRIPAWVVRSLDDLKVELITEGFDG